MAVDWTGYKLAPDFSGLAQGIAQYGANKQAAAQFQQEMDYKNRALAADTEAKRQAMLGGVNKFAPTVSYGQNLYKGNDDGIYRPVYMTDRNTGETSTSYVNEITGQPVDPSIVPELGLKMTTSSLVTAPEAIKSEVSKAEQIENVKTKSFLEQLRGGQLIKLATQPDIEAAVTRANTIAKEEGTDLYTLKDLDSRLPNMYTMANNLKKLAAVATYTKGGTIADTMIKELGFGTTEGEDAKVQYQAIVNNEILPMLKITFGSAFTVAEGDALRETLGGNQYSPKQKVAIVEAFIKQKESQVRRLGKKFGIPENNIATQRQTQDVPQTQNQSINWSDY